MLMQVIKNLDELVSDIEDTRAHPYGPGGLTRHAVQHKLSSKQQHHTPQQSVQDVLADVARQLSAKCDLHDSLLCQ